ncbi:MAG: ribose-phosphate pyrophosphokinase [Thermaerobacter sp.]|nr:ribose-phosphate pyrophosphokinase [Thermaerobacter sp.]
MGYREGELKVFTGSANVPLADAIAAQIGVGLGDMQVGRFSNGEVRVMIRDNVRGCDVFVIQPICDPVNENLMELLVMLDAFRRASPQRVTAVIPYYGYARQDRKTSGREPITAKLVANLLSTAGADRILTMDLHAPQIQGFFDIPLDHLTGVPILARYFKEKALQDGIVIAPDAGGGNRARELAERLDLPIGFVDKRRPEPGVSEVMHIIGKVQGRTCVIVDDMIDTGGTISEAAVALLARGAQEIYVACTHPVLSGPGVERLSRAPIREVVVTDSIPLRPEANGRFRVLSVAPLLGEAITRIHEDESVSLLFQ